MDIDDFGIDLWSGVLSGAPLFEHVDLALLAPELHAGHELSLEAGHILLDPQHVNDNILMILKGELMVCLEPTVARPLVRLRAGDCVGELSVIDGLAAPPQAHPQTWKT